MVISASSIAEAKPQARAQMTLLAMILVEFPVVLDTFVTAVILPQVGHSLNASLAQLQWVVIPYVLLMGALAIPFGRMGDRLGHRLILMLGLWIFTLGAAACALAPNVAWMIAGRILQGAGAGAIMPTALAIVGQAFPPEQRGKALTVLNASSLIAILGGPMLGAFLTEYVHWRAAFWVNLPLCLVAAGLILRHVEETPASGGEDGAGWWAALTLTSAVVFAILALNSLAVGQSGAVQAAGLAALAVGCLLIFRGGERRSSTPFLDPRLLNRQMGRLLLVTGVSNAAVFGMLSFTSLMLQNVTGASSLQIGTIVLVTSLAAAVTMIGGGVAADRRPDQRRVWLAAGGALLCAGHLLMAYLTVSGVRDLMVLTLPLVVQSLGAGTIVALTSVFVIAEAPPEITGLASGLWGSSRFAGTSIGTALWGCVIGLIMRQQGLGLAAPAHATADLAAPITGEHAAALQAMAMRGYAGACMLAAVLVGLAFCVWMTGRAAPALEADRSSNRSEA